VITSGMVSVQEMSKKIGVVCLLVLVCVAAVQLAGAQNAAPAGQSAAGVPSILDRLQAMMSGGKSAWTPEQLATMELLRDAAMKDPYALDELRHLTYNIGPRLSGSPQAAKAVDYVAGEMRALGAEVTLEKAKVPHWVRGEEKGDVAEGGADGAGRERGDAAGGDYCRGGGGGRLESASCVACGRGSGEDSVVQPQV
jgi:hypothetical protein